MKYHKFGLAVAGMLLVFGWQVAARGAPAKQRPNILVIFSDDHAQKALSCYGNTDIETPGLDRLAAEGMRFTHAVTPNSFCTPSRAVVLTGKYSHKNGVTHLNQSFDGSQQTFPKLMQEAGYETSLFGKWHLLSQPTGFDFYCVQKMQGMPVDPIVFETGMPWVPWSPQDQQSYRQGGRKLKGYNNDVITTEAITWLKEKRNTEKPFCLCLQPKPPHQPYEPPPKYEEFLEGVFIPEPVTLLDDYEGRTPKAIEHVMGANRLVLGPAFKDIRKQLEKENPGISRDELTRGIYQAFIKSYYRLVKSVDDNVARVLDYLDESGLADDTLVIYTSDQGFSLGEHGFYNKQWMYEAPLHQPLLVRLPGVIAAGSVHESLVSHVDLAPTILDYAGVAVPCAMQGHSLKNLLEQQANKVRDAVYYHFYEHGKQLPEMLGIRTETHKLIHYPGMPKDVQWELFDLERDPDEMQNRYGDPHSKGVREQLKNHLRQLIKEVQDPVKAPALMQAGRGRKTSVWQAGKTAVVFDGKTLDNWMLENGSPVPSGWEVVDGTIHRSSGTKRIGSIVTRKEYGDFDLSFEWKIAQGGNSGVKYRVQKYGRRMLGCEYQIFDKQKPGAAFGKHSTGSLYGLYEPVLKAVIEPSGQFNASRIVSHRNRIQHWLNGDLIVSATVGSPDWDARIAESKFSDRHGFARASRGRIMLTDHGSEVWYRNLRLIPLQGVGVEESTEPTNSPVSDTGGGNARDLTRAANVSGSDKVIRPNIVLMMSDDQGWGETGYNGHHYLKTPVLDEMAMAGLRLDRFYAASPVCSPTRASVLTGRHANRSGAFGAGWSIRPEEVTLAQVLKAAGYRTGHFGKWHIGAVKRGSPLSPNSLGFDESLSHDNFFEMNPELSRNGGPAEVFPGEGSEILVGEALRFVQRSRDEGQPFFVVLWFGSPHAPYEASEQDCAAYKHLGAELSQRFGEIAAMDRAIGIFRKGLDELGVRDNTLVWFNSDNGITKEGVPREQWPNLFESGGLRGHKSQMYEGGLRVPCVIEWPAVITAPRKSSIPCVTSDIMPTILDLLDIRHPENHRPLDGVSLKRLVVEGSMRSRERPIGFWGYDREFEENNERWMSDNALNEMITLTEKQKAVRVKRPDARWYFKNHSHPVANTDPKGPAAWIEGCWKLFVGRDGHATSYELYDLAADPGEAANVASQHSERVRAMAECLNAWKQSVELSLTGVDYALRPTGQE